MPVQLVSHSVGIAIRDQNILSLEEKFSQILDKVRNLNSNAPKRIYINSGEQLPGTEVQGKSLRMPANGSKAVFSQKLSTPNLNGIKGRTMTLNFNGLVHVCNNPERVRELRAFNKPLQTFIWDILKRFSNFKAEDRGHFYVQQDMRSGIKGFNIMCFQPLEKNQRTDAANVAAVYLVLKDFSSSGCYEFLTCFNLTQRRIQVLQANPELQQINGPAFAESSSKLGKVKVVPATSKPAKKKENKDDASLSRLSIQNNKSSATDQSSSSKKITAQLTVDTPIEQDRKYVELSTLLDKIGDAISISSHYFDLLKSAPLPEADQRLLKGLGLEPKSLGEFEKILSSKNQKQAENVKLAVSVIMSISNLSKFSPLMKLITNLKETMALMMVFDEKYEGLNLHKADQTQLERNRREAFLEIGSLHDGLIGFMKPLVSNYTGYLNELAANQGLKVLRIEGTDLKMDAHTEFENDETFFHRYDLAQRDFTKQASHLSGSDHSWFSIDSKDNLANMNALKYLISLKSLYSDSNDMELFKGLDILVQNMDPKKNAEIAMMNKTIDLFNQLIETDSAMGFSEAEFNRLLNIMNHIVDLLNDSKKYELDDRVQAHYNSYAEQMAVLDMSINNVPDRILSKMNDFDKKSPLLLKRDIEKYTLEVRHEIEPLAKNIENFSNIIMFDLAKQNLALHEKKMTAIQKIMSLGIKTSNGFKSSFEVFSQSYDQLSALIQQGEGKPVAENLYKHMVALNTASDKLKN